VSLAEREFARFLRKNGFDFDTQVQIKSYIVDVVFPSEHVAVEFDGDYWHDLPRTAAKDRKKDAALRQLGYEVIRVRQTAHEADPAASLARISSAITREVVQ
jgi:very-short-patch-repair endonuclease